MVALSVLAFVRLRGIATQAAVLDGDSIPGLYLVGRMQAVSVQTYLSTEQHILERDPAQMQRIMAYIQQKTVERFDLLKQYEPTLTTSKERELYEATNAALAPYMVVRNRILKLRDGATITLQIRCNGVVPSRQCVAVF